MSVMVGCQAPSTPPAATSPSSALPSIAKTYKFKGKELPLTLTTVHSKQPGANQQALAAKYKLASLPCDGRGWVMDNWTNYRLFEDEVYAREFFDGDPTLDLVVWEPGMFSFAMFDPMMGAIIHEFWLLDSGDVLEIVWGGWGGEMCWPGSGGVSTPAPTPTPAPELALKPKDNETAFSPNDDEVKDTIDLLIISSSQEEWTLSVDGQTGKLASGKGDTGYTWRGNPNDQSNGIILPDGKYTLRLKAGSEEETAEVVIDKTAPEIKDITVTPNANGVVIAASIKDPDTYSSKVDERSITLSSNGSEIGEGSREYNGESGAFTLALTHEQIGRLAPKYSVSDNHILFKASDLAGVKAEEKQEFTAPTEDVAYAVHKSGYGVASVGLDKDVLRPLLEQTLTVTTYALPIPAGTFQPPAIYISGIYQDIGGIYNPFSPIKSETYIYPPYVNHSFSWDGKVDAARPYSAGQYYTVGRMQGFWEHKLIPFTIDNKVLYDWKNQPKDINKQNHVLWGSKPRRNAGKYHKWSLYAPISDPSPIKGDNPLITSIYNSHVLPQIKSTVDLKYQTGAPQRQGSGFEVTYSRPTIVGGSPHNIVVHTFRSFSAKEDSILEQVVDSYVQ